MNSPNTFSIHSESILQRHSCVHLSLTQDQHTLEFWEILLKVRLETISECLSLPLPLSVVLSLCDLSFLITEWFCLFQQNQKCLSLWISVLLLFVRYRTLSYSHSLTHLSSQQVFVSWTEEFESKANRITHTSDIVCETESERDRHTQTLYVLFPSFQHIVVVWVPSHRQSYLFVCECVYICVCVVTYLVLWERWVWCLKYRITCECGRYTHTKIYIERETYIWHNVERYLWECPLEIIEIVWIFLQLLQLSSC